MRILGISAFHRDSAAALVVDGKVVAAAQEEHFTRLSRDSAFPSRAVRFVLGAGGVTAPDLDHVVFYEKPLKKFERVLIGNLRGFPRSSTSFAKGLFTWLGDRVWVKHRIASDLGLDPDKILFSNQLESLASCALRTSPFDEAALLVLDDAGEWATTLLARGGPDGIESLAEVDFPHSLGLLASAITQFLGFVPGEDEDKVEALAAFGEPRFAEGMARWIRPSEGLFELEPGVFRFEYEGKHLFGPAVEELLGAPRFAGDTLRYLEPDTRDADVAASLQVVLEDEAVRLARELHRRAPSTNLCMAGALAGNRRLLMRLRAEGPFEAIHVPQTFGKAGGALGAALLAEPGLNGAGRIADDALVGESISGLAEPGARELTDDPDGLSEVARRLAGGEVVGWATGAIEAGQASLQNRIVLVGAGGEDATKRLLGAVQQVESFLPSRLAVTAEAAARFVELPSGLDGALRRARLRVDAKAELAAVAPSAVLPDGSVWIQVVDRGAHPRLHALLERIGEGGGAPLVLCTDLKLRGSPIVRNEGEAVEAYMRSTIDTLVVASRVYEREQLPTKH